MRRKWIYLIALLLIAVLVFWKFIYAPQTKLGEIMARDQQRKSDIKKLQTALELYYQNNHKYPLNPGDKVYVTSNSANELNQKLVSQYLPQTINDPGNPNNKNQPQYFYWQVNTTTYFLFSNLENTNNLDAKPAPTDGTTTARTYAIQIGSITVSYNYWVSNLGVKPGTTPTPSPSPTVTTFPSPTPTNTPQGPSFTPPGKGKK